MREVSLFAGYSRAELTTAVCVLGMACTTAFISDIGYYMLDVVDAYISSYGLLFVGFFEAFGAGWLYNKAASAERVGNGPMMLFDISVLGGFATFSIISVFEGSDSIGLAIGVALPLILLGGGAAVAAGSSQAGGAKEAAYYLGMHGPDSLKDMINDAVTDGKEGNWKLGRGWVVLVKYIITPMLLHLLTLSTEAKISADGYGGYPVGIQLVGAFTFISLVLHVALGAAMPSWYKGPRGEIELPVANVDADNY